MGPLLVHSLEQSSCNFLLLLPALVGVRIRDEVALGP